MLGAESKVCHLHTLQSGLVFFLYGEDVRLGINLVVRRRCEYDMNIMFRDTTVDQRCPKPTGPRSNFRIENTEPVRMFCFINKVSIVLSKMESLLILFKSVGGDRSNWNA